MKAAKAYSAWNFIPPIGFLIVVATVKGDIVLAVILAYLILGVIMA